MSYLVKDVFYTLQGEGFHAGRPAVFLRFAGCNLWSGREEDREKGRGGCSRWCDTDFLGGTRYEDEHVLAEKVALLWPGGGTRFVVLTGGEPGLQVDKKLVDALHLRGFEVAVETNGTCELPEGVDWVCISPKLGGKVRLTRAHELKLAFPQAFVTPETLVEFPVFYRWLQPIDGPNRDINTLAAIEYVQKNPIWRLSRQNHKDWKIP